VFRFLGAAGCAATFVLLTTLTAYYSVSRPHVPQPDRQWTVPFYWSFSPPSYGTARETGFLISLHSWFFLFFLLIIVGEAIRIYKLENGKGYGRDDNGT
jgi:hypothetical protein